MNIPENISATISRYKSFTGEHQGLSFVSPITVIIGRNNTGKSALLDLIEFLCAPGKVRSFRQSGHAPSARLSVLIPESAVTAVFQKSTSGGNVEDMPVPFNHYEFGKAFAGTQITFEIDSENKRSFVSAESTMTPRVGNALTSRMSNPFDNLEFRRIYADRDIQPEHSDKNVVLKGNGEGATNLIHHVLTDSTANEYLVREAMLKSLNRIFVPDAQFSRITTKHNSASDSWEIYLEEDSKGLIPLTASGSGLKTVLLALTNLLLLPAIENRPLSSYLFGFEELENNLHPGLQRRLFAVLRDMTISGGTTLFLTTHSSVVIDLFDSDPDSQMLHVTHNGASAEVVSLSEVSHHRRVLDDLDIRASDILQSNGIIWVEGPSDRIYIDHLLRTIFGSRFREGIHYQCVFYGGKLLRRVTAGDIDDAVRLLRLNRNCAVLMDRDTTELNETKRRIREEVSAVGGHVWVTAKKEIECILPLLSIRAYFDDPSIPSIVDKIEPFRAYLDRVRPGEGHTYSRDKVLFAENICGFLTEESVRADSELTESVEELGRVIEGWNPGV